MDNQQQDNQASQSDWKTASSQREQLEGLDRPMSPEQYAKEIRNAYLAVGLVAFVFVLIVLGVTISWI